MTTRDDQIRQRAHEIWEREGRPEGRQEEHWQRAVEEIERELGTDGAQPAPKASRSRSYVRSGQTSPGSSRTPKTNPTEASAENETPRKTRKPRGATASTASFATRNGSAAVSPAGEAEHKATEQNNDGRAPQPATGAVKYRHPETPDLTWSGRGRRPTWIRDALEAGGQLTDFEVGA